MLHYIEQELRGKRDLALRVSIENVSRRGVLGGLLTTTGLILAVDFSPAIAREAVKPYGTGGDGMPNKTVNDPKIFVSIAKDGTVTIMSHRAEMGTGVSTSLPMVVADEMEADWSKVKIVATDGDEPKYGNQDTDGSRSMRHFIQAMRQCGAAMRTMLEAAAAAKLGVDPAMCVAKNHMVVVLDKDKKETGKSIGFGDLAEAAMALPVPAIDKLLLKSPDEFRYIGKGEIKAHDHRNITTGKAIYGADVRLPGMKYAVMARPLVLGGKIKKWDGAAALKVPGVVAVHEIAGVYDNPRKYGILGGIAVVANSTYAALKGRDALVIEWDNGSNDYDSVAYNKEMLATAAQPGKVIRKQGDVDAAFKNAKQTFSADYQAAHISQAAMEPLVAVAQIKDGKCEVWAPAQSPFGAKNDVVGALKMKPEDVTLHLTLLGGGFGRKSKSDYIQEAALVSQKMGGVPILLQWTREDDLRHGFYHTVSVERVEMAFDDKGKCTAWRHRSVAPSIISTFVEDTGYKFFIEQGMDHVNVPYEVPNVSCEDGKAMAKTRIGWFRSVSNIPHLWATGSAVCEAALQLGKDPKDFLLELVGSDRTINPKELGFPEDFWHYGDPIEEFPMETARLKNAINVAAEKAGWGKKLPEGEGLGICAHIAWQSYVATVVHVKVDKDGTIRVPEVHTAIDCGFAVNPERVRAQIEGAAVQGMSTTLYSAITFKKGAVEQSNFTDFNIARMSNYPVKTHVHIINGKPSRPAGVGEPGLPPFHAALANAVQAATKKRVRNMPMGEKIT